VFIKVVGTSSTEMFAANDWKPFQSCSIAALKLLQPQSIWRNTMTIFGVRARILLVHRAQSNVVSYILHRSKITQGMMCWDGASFRTVSSIFFLTTCVAGLNFKYVGIIHFHEF
jgi:hypothetical protein